MDTPRSPLSLPAGSISSTAITVGLVEAVARLEGWQRVAAIAIVAIVAISRHWATSRGLQSAKLPLPPAAILLVVFLAPAARAEPPAAVAVPAPTVVAAPASSAVPAVVAGQVVDHCAACVSGVAKVVAPSWLERNGKWIALGASIAGTAFGVAQALAAYGVFAPRSASDTVP